jgi:hypothetical protein
MLTRPALFSGVAMTMGGYTETDEVSDFKHIATRRCGILAMTGLGCLRDRPRRFSSDRLVRLSGPTCSQRANVDSRWKTSEVFAPLVMTNVYA